MNFLKLTKGAVITSAALLLVAGGVAQPVQCGMASCCCMPEITDDLAFQQSHCGCGCGQFEESRVPDQSAVTIAVVESAPVKAEIDFAIENNSGIFEDGNSYTLNGDNNSHSPPLILDNRYTPLLC